MTWSHIKVTPVDSGNMVAVALAPGWTGPTVAYMMSQVWEVLVPTFFSSCYYNEKEKVEGEAGGEKGMRAMCLLSYFLLSRGVVNFGV